jgi:hypothetical protein
MGRIRPLTTTLVLFPSLTFFGLLGSAKAESSTPAESEKAQEASEPAPEAGQAPAVPEPEKKPAAPEAAEKPVVPEAAENAAAPEAEASAPPAPAAPKCECPPPCPAPTPPPPVPPATTVEWKAQSKGGMSITSGNAESKNFIFGLNASRKEGNNKLALEGGLAYGTTNALVLSSDAGGNQTVGREQVTSSNNWAAKARYDRFITDNNILFASAQGGGDKVAGKSFFGGGQLGYSRQLLKDQWNTVVAELGYDFSYERYVQPDVSPALDAVEIHSVRVFVGETLSLTKETGVTANVEALFNLNRETNAIDVKTGETGVDAFKDARVNGKLGLTTNLWESLSFGFSFTFKYDQNPAPRPVPKNAPAGFAFDKGNPDLYYADKVDTSTEATLIYTFF